MNQSDFIEIIKQNNFDLFKEKKDYINKIYLNTLIETCVLEKRYDFFDYIIDNFNFNWSYDDSVLFNYSLEIKNIKFAKKISKLEGIKVNNDDNWCLKHAINHNNYDIIDFLLTFEEIISNIDKDWIENSTYVDTSYILNKVEIHKNKTKIDKF